MPLSFAELQDLEGLLRALGVPTEASLRPGISPNRFAQLVEPLPYEVSHDCWTLWSWHDGLDPDVVPPALPWWFLPLERALDLADQLVVESRAFARETNEAPWWDETWLPIVNKGSRGIIAVDCAAADRDEVVCVLPPEPGTPPPTRLNGLSELIRLWNEALHAGMWRFSAGWSRDPALMVDPDPLGDFR